MNQTVVNKHRKNATSLFGRFFNPLSLKVISVSPEEVISETSIQGNQTSQRTLSSVYDNTALVRALSLKTNTTTPEKYTEVWRQDNLLSDLDEICFIPKWKAGSKLAIIFDTNSLNETTRTALLKFCKEYKDKLFNSFNPYGVTNKNVLSNVANNGVFPTFRATSKVKGFLINTKEKEYFKVDVKSFSFSKVQVVVENLELLQSSDAIYISFYGRKCVVKTETIRANKINDQKVVADLSLKFSNYKYLKKWLDFNHSNVIARDKRKIEDIESQPDHLVIL